MRTKLSSLIVILFIAIQCFGQKTFQKVISTGVSCQANSIEQTTDGGYIIVGDNNIDNSYTSQIYLVKTDADGNTIWTRTYGTGYDYGNSVKQTSDGGYILTGSVSGNIIIIKTNSLGDTLWTNLYSDSSGTSYGYSVQVMNDGYIFTGISNDKLLLLKTNTNGVIIWNKEYSTGNVGYSIKQTSDTGLIACGLDSSRHDLYLLKTNYNGDTLWSKIYCNVNGLTAEIAEETSDHGYIAIDDGYGNDGMDLIKTNMNGDTIWKKSYGNVDDYPLDAHQTTDGGYIITGTSVNIGENAFLIKTDSDGDTLWTRSYNVFGYIYTTWSNSVKQTTDGGYIMAGFTYNPSGKSSIYIIKTDANGNSGCNQYQHAFNVGASTVSCVLNKHPIITSFIDQKFTSLIVGTSGIDSNICSLTGFKELTKINMLYISPNPVYDDLNIYSASLNNQIATISIINILGEVIQKERIKESSEIRRNIKELPSGIYFVYLSDENEMWIGRFVKQ